MHSSTSVDLAAADRPFDNIINFRDVGVSINSLCGSRILKEGVLFRSARLDDASERDKRRLLDELRISTVIDLRSSTEHQMALEKASPDSDQPDPDQPDQPDQPDEPQPSWRLNPISLTGKTFERALLWRLDWLTYLKVLSLATLGYRPSAVQLVCAHALRPRGLIGLAIDTLEHSAVELRQVFAALADPAAYPVLVHCTQGKDRTGLVVALILLLTGCVHEEAVSADYGRSEAGLLDELDERLEEIRRMGLGDEFAKCPPGFVGAVQEFLAGRFGGVKGYLVHGLGVGEEILEVVRGLLVA
ncbi:tyrosine serine protein phosphatase [Aspergillus sp. HF37]|nr:tyrosine serine protein phosphatase [Aspergillus sp. HF37]